MLKDDTIAKLETRLCHIMRTQIVVGRAAQDPSDLLSIGIFKQVDTNGKPHSVYVVDSTDQRVLDFMIDVTILHV